MARRGRREEFRIIPIDTEKDVAIGVKLPFGSSNGGLFTLSYTTEEQGISNLKNLLLTRKGERYLQPNFGTGIYDILFEPMTADTPSQLQASVLRDIDFWLPYIIVDDFIVNEPTNVPVGMFGHGLQLIFKFRVTENGANQTITLNVGSNGSANIV